MSDNLEEMRQAIKKRVMELSEDEIAELARAIDEGLICSRQEEN